MKKILTPIILFLILLLNFNSILFAQEAVSKNDTLRITAPAFYLYPIYGKLVALNADSISFIFNTNSYILPLKEVEKIEIKSIPHRNTFMGAAIGGIIGGLFFGFIVENDSHNSGMYSFDMGFKEGSLFGGITGALTGGLIGYLIKTTSWEEVKNPNTTIRN